MPGTAEGGRVVVQQAETGTSFALDVAGDSECVGILQSALERAAGVPLAHQILLLDGVKLEADRALSEYGLPSRDARDRPVFLFSRKSLSRSAPPPEPLPVVPLELVVPAELAPAQQPREPTEAASPLVRALLDYERHFFLHQVQGLSAVEASKARLEAAARCLSGLSIQGAAQRSAVANLRGFAAQLSERYAEFQERYADVTPQQADLVRSFEADLETLRAVSIDPAVCALEGWEAATLLDSCGEDRLRTWLAECQHNTDHLVNKAGQFALSWGDEEAELPMGKNPVENRGESSVL